MKKFFGCLIVILASACANPTATLAPTSAGDIQTAVVATLTQQAASSTNATPESAPVDGTRFANENISLIIPNGLATNAASIAPADYEYPYINPSNGNMPPHLKFTLESYPLSGTLLQPQIILFHAEAYAQYSEFTATTFNLLQNLNYVDGQPLPEQLNGQLFTAQVHGLNFKNGHGVRYLTQVAQSLVTANNHEMFYYFQGVTNDNQYFVQAIFPIHAPFLANDAAPDAPLPADGIPLNENDFTGYLHAVTEKLNLTASSAFTPTLDQLDGLIESLEVIGY
ncbi:MAG: hypothetical protein IT310_02160 [Anaerolineales bacterium]|nr:hypothetical protein [Anaerolineales bacterium]